MGNVQPQQINMYRPTAVTFPVLFYCKWKWIKIQKTACNKYLYLLYDHNLPRIAESFNFDDPIDNTTL